MTCRKCPHHVRHGQVASDGSSILFKDLCGLRHKQAQDTEAPLKKGMRGRGRPVDVVKRKPLPDGATMECLHYPFPDPFEYLSCSIYQENFSATEHRNDVLLSRELHYTEQLSDFAVTDLELL